MVVDVIHFNPTYRRPGLRGRLLRRRPLNNFGDLLGPLLVARIVEDEGLAPVPDADVRLVTIGSIMKLTQPGDVVWGTGVNGKSMDIGAAPALDVRAVRGPRTQALLQKAGVSVPTVFGDPALLWPRYWPRESYLRSSAAKPRPVSVVPNFHDIAVLDGPSMVNPLGDPHEIIGQIAASDFVCGSSLHGIVLAEAFGIPARLIVSATEHPFKYDDYYAGTGRRTYTPATDVSDAIRMGGEPAPRFDPDCLLAAFPRDLWEAAATDGPR